MDVFDNFADLTLNPTISADDSAQVLGYYTPGDGGGGNFYWDASSSEAENGGTIIALSPLVTGRWKRLYNGEININWFGAIGDASTDNTLVIQKAIDALGPNGGRIIIDPLPYKVEGTITVNRNISISGTTNYNFKHTDAGTKILHDPSEAGTDLFISGAVDIGSGQIGGIVIENLMILGTENSRRAINFQGPANLIVRNIHTDTFEDAVVLDLALNSSFYDCDFIGNSNSCVRFTGDISTTVQFNNCYMHVSNWAVIIESGRGLGITFNACIVESCCVGGYDIHCDNIVTLVSPYAENIPDTALPDLPIIQVGVNGTEINPGYPLGMLSIFGGTIAGHNADIITSGSVLIKADKQQIIAVYGTTFQRADRLIDTTSDLKLAQFTGIGLNQIISRDGGIYSTRSVFFDKIIDVNTPRLYVETVSVNFNGTSNWRIEDVYQYTDSDLLITKNGETVVAFDNQKNMKFNFPGGTGSAEKVQFFGAVTTPNFSGGDPSAAMWAEADGNGLIMLHQRDSAGDLYVMGQLIKPTASRPTNNYVGRQMYDTTINKPIWWNGSVWKDALGTTV